MTNLSGPRICGLQFTKYTQVSSLPFFIFLSFFLAPPALSLQSNVLFFHIQKGHISLQCNVLPGVPVIKVLNVIETER